MNTFHDNLQFSVALLIFYPLKKLQSKNIAHKWSRFYKENFIQTRRYEFCHTLLYLNSSISNWNVHSTWPTDHQCLRRVKVYSVLIYGTSNCIWNQTKCFKMVKRFVYSFMVLDQRCIYLKGREIYHFPTDKAITLNSKTFLSAFIHTMAWNS